MSIFNIKQYIDSLPNDIETIDVSNKNIDYLPDLSRFKHLKQLYCYNNQLTSLPNLNDNLQKLYCWENQLTSLPNLNENLQKLYCSNNQLNSLPNLNKNLQELSCWNNELTSLPNLNKNLQIFNCYENPIYIVVNDNNDNLIKLNIQKINNFKHLYYCLKFKSRFRKILWEKIREPKIIKHYNPKYLIENLKENYKLEEILNSW